MSLKILILGDVVGRPGRRVVKELLPDIINEFQVDYVIANAENAAGGNGLTPEVARELYHSGIDFLTMGNHVWDKKEIMTYIETEERIIRPANYPPDTPGRGYAIRTLASNLKVGIINLSGRVFLDNLDCPFRKADELIKEIRKYTPIIVVDFHAEATSEKVAMGWYLNGRVSAVLGTHTHIQTADERIFPEGTAYITDVGMNGPRDSVLGVKTNLVLKRFLTQLPVRFEVASGVAQFNAILLKINPENGKAVSIERIQQYK